MCFAFAWCGKIESDRLGRREKEGGQDAKSIAKYEECFHCKFVNNASAFYFSRAIFQFNGTVFAMNTHDVWVCIYVYRLLICLEIVACTSAKNCKLALFECFDTLKCVGIRIDLRAKSLENLSIAI